jgi:hypothetical protein
VCERVCVRECVCVCVNVCMCVCVGLGEVLECFKSLNVVEELKSLRA